MGHAVRLEDGRNQFVKGFHRQSGAGRGERVGRANGCRTRADIPSTVKTANMSTGKLVGSTQLASAASP